MDTATQSVTAFEDDKAVLVARCSSGGKGTKTPLGKFQTFHKGPTIHMTNDGEADAGHGYDLPGVPWVSFFTGTGDSFHGTYWHNDYGKPRSHGCVNLTPADAKFIYRWTLPWFRPIRSIFTSRAKGRTSRSFHQQLIEGIMPRQPLFAGLVVDEHDRVAESALVGEEPFYVVDDAGFRRHIPAAQVDRQVLKKMQEMMKGSEGLISEQTAKMLGQEDIFSKALIEQQLKNMDQQFDALMQQGIPEEGRAYLGMLGFKVVINLHGEIVRVEQPSAPDNGEGEIMNNLIQMNQAYRWA